MGSDVTAKGGTKLFQYIMEQMEGFKLIPIVLES